MHNAVPIARYTADTREESSGAAVISKWWQAEARSVHVKEHDEKRSSVALHLELKRSYKLPVCAVVSTRLNCAPYFSHRSSSEHSRGRQWSHHGIRRRSGSLCTYYSVCAHVTACVCLCLCVCMCVVCVCACECIRESVHASVCTLVCVWIFEHFMYLMYISGWIRLGFDTCTLVLFIYTLTQTTTKCLCIDDSWEHLQCVKYAYWVLGMCLGKWITACELRRANLTKQSSGVDVLRECCHSSFLAGGGPPWICRQFV